MFGLIDIHVGCILPVVYSSKLVWYLKKYKISGQLTNEPIVLVDCNDAGKTTRISTGSSVTQRHMGVRGTSNES